MVQKKPAPDVTDLVQALSLLIRRLRAVSGAKPLSWTEEIIMRRLDKEGPATAADLSREVGIKPQSMGTAIAGLEKMGLVARKPHPTDGRQFNIELTVQGAALRQSGSEAKRSWLAGAIAELDPKDQKTLFEAGEIMQRLAES
jgi:DNA-binding MarR family transcriptional regulator